VHHHHSHSLDGPTFPLRIKLGGGQLPILPVYRIPTRVVHRYLELLSDENICLPKDPEAVIAKLLLSITDLHDGILLSKEWVFVANGNEIASIRRLPQTTFHAKLRLEERVGVPRQYISVHLARVIVFGRYLPRGERRRSRYRDTRDVIDYDRHRYIISNDGSLITVIPENVEEES
jgi:hypothetical protein